MHRKKLKKSLLLIMTVLLCLLACAAFADECEKGGNHEWYVADKKEVTCTENGYQILACSKCGMQRKTNEIVASGHDMVTSVVREPSCTVDGQKDTRCRYCSLFSGSESIPAPGHAWGEWYTLKQPTCTESGLKCQDCARGDATNTLPLDPLGHDYTVIETVLQPTCTTQGQKKISCSRCGDVHYDDIPALGHNFGEWTNVRSATCTEDGLDQRLCSRCNLLDQRTIPMLGHAMGDWVIKEPTCLENGEKHRQCSQCELSESQPIPALGHDMGDWVTVKEPTCDEPGEKQRYCSRCNTAESQTISALGHKWSEWVVVTEPTGKTDGLKERTCENCGEKETAVIPRLGFYGNTMCAFGPRLKDMDYRLAPYTTDNWYMVTPFDASVDGTQTFELVASNMYIVGELTLTVKDGYITVDYELFSNQIDVDLEFFTIFNSIDDLIALRTYEPERMLQLRMKRLVPVSMEEAFGGDTNLLLYFCSRVDYYYDPAHMEPLDYDSRIHTGILTEMNRLMLIDEQNHG